jgi:hypothetical protein
MLKIDGKNIDITRGNVLPLTIDTKQYEGDVPYEFQVGDIVRFTIMENGNVKNIFLQKDFEVTEPTTELEIVITANEMKIGEISSEAVKYWYEVELAPDTDYTQTIIGYDLEEGAAILTLLPEGGDKQ